jgi:ribonuclease P/MRP protein subunit RPP1
LELFQVRVLKLYDLCLKYENEDLVSKARELSWQDPSEYDTLVLEEAEWGKMKRQVDQNRDEYHVLCVNGGSQKINREAVSDPRIDLLIHPGKDRKDSGFDRGTAQLAAQNNVSLCLDFSRILEEDKQRTHVLSEWRKNLGLCNKYNADFTVSTFATKEYELRHPRDLMSMIESLGFPGTKAFDTSETIIEKNRRKLNSDSPSGVWKR